MTDSATIAAITTTSAPASRASTPSYSPAETVALPDTASLGAEDANFNGTWEVILGKEVSREKGVDLSDVEILANCLVNMCFISKYPRPFEEAHKALLKE